MDKRYQYHVFLSHVQLSGGDRCMLLAEELRAKGLRVWYDMDQEPTADGMEKGIKTSACVIAFFSDQYLTRPAVHRELYHSLLEKKRIVYVVCEGELEPPLASLISQGLRFLEDTEARRRDELTSRPFLNHTLLLGSQDSLLPGGQLPSDCSVTYKCWDPASSAEAILKKVSASIDLGSVAPLGATDLPREYKHKMKPIETHVLLAAGAKCTPQLDFLRHAMTLRCKTLNISTLPSSLLPQHAVAAVSLLGGGISMPMAEPVGPGASSATFELPSLQASEEDAFAMEKGWAAARNAKCLLVVLGADIFANPYACGALLAAVQSDNPEQPQHYRRGPILIALNEMDEQKGGVKSFSDYFSMVPSYLNTLFDKVIVRQFQRRMYEREGMLTE